MILFILFYFIQTCVFRWPSTTNCASCGNVQTYWRRKPLCYTLLLLKSVLRRTHTTADAHSHIHVYLWWCTVNVLAHIRYPLTVQSTMLVHPYTHVWFHFIWMYAHNNLFNLRKSRLWLTNMCCHWKFIKKIILFFIHTSTFSMPSLIKVKYSRLSERIIFLRHFCKKNIYSVNNGRFCE